MSAQTPPTGATSGELVRWAFARLIERDLDSLRQAWHDDIVERFPDGTYRGPTQVAGYFEQLFAALPDWHMDVLTIVEQGDDVFAHWKLTGTHSGGVFQGIAPTGRHIDVDGMDHFVVRDGKVVSNFVVFDQMQFARCIGMLPPDGSRADRAVKSAFNARSKLVARLHRI